MFSKFSPFVSRHLSLSRACLAAPPEKLLIQHHERSPSLLVKDSRKIKGCYFYQRALNGLSNLISSLLQPVPGQLYLVKYIRNISCLMILWLYWLMFRYLLIFPRYSIIADLLVSYKLPNKFTVASFIAKSDKNDLFVNIKCN